MTPFTDREIGVLHRTGSHGDTLSANLSRLIDDRLSTAQPYECDDGRPTRRGSKALGLASNHLADVEVAGRPSHSV